MAPGPFLGIVLSGIDVNTISGHDRIIVLRAQERLVAHYTAQSYKTMTAVVDAYETEEGCDLEGAAEGASYELRCALQLTRRAADVEVAFALDLRDRLPRVWDALALGDIDRRRASVIVRETTHLEDDTARAVVDRIIADAPRWTTGQLMARIRKLCIAVAPDEARRRYEHAVEERRVVGEPTDAGTANLLGLGLPPHRVAAAQRRINQLAKTLRGSNETRTMDQLRADVYMDLLTGKTTAGKGGTVDIRVDLDTLTGLSDTPGELGGYGPVIADITRQVAEQQERAKWRYTVTDPASGQPIAAGLTRRRPTAQQRRLIEATHTTCVFPGCRMPATECDLDHRVEWSKGGPTTVENQKPLCRHDHTGRHDKGWTYEVLPNGDIRWTSPLGHVNAVRARDP